MPRTEADPMLSWHLRGTQVLKREDATWGLDLRSKIGRVWAGEGAEVKKRLFQAEDIGEPHGEQVGRACPGEGIMGTKQEVGPGGAIT